MNHLDHMMMKPYATPILPKKALPPTVNPEAKTNLLTAVLLGPVTSIDQAASSVMLDANLFMLVNGAGFAVWGIA
jgi:hypothetical protein